MSKPVITRRGDILGMTTVNLRRFFRQSRVEFDDRLHRHQKKLRDLVVGWPRYISKSKIYEDYDLFWPREAVLYLARKSVQREQVIAAFVAVEVDHAVTFTASVDDFIPIAPPPEPTPEPLTDRALLEDIAERVRRIEEVFPALLRQGRLI